MPLRASKFCTESVRCVVVVVVVVCVCVFVCVCVCETWSLSLREEHRLRVFENRVLRDEVTVEWRRLHDEKV